MRVAIVGSRRRDDPATAAIVAAVVESLPDDATVVSGGARGPDAFAADAARRRGLAVVVERPDYRGVASRVAAARALLERNGRIVEGADLLVAFPSADRTGGTEDTIRRAKRAGVPVFVALPGETWLAREAPRARRRRPGAPAGRPLPLPHPHPGRGGAGGAP